MYIDAENTGAPLVPNLDERSAPPAETMYESVWSHRASTPGGHRRQ